MDPSKHRALAGLSAAELAERAVLRAGKFHVEIIVLREAMCLPERDGSYLVVLDRGEESWLSAR